MHINLSHCLASTLIWVFFGLPPNPRYVILFRSVGVQNHSHDLFWRFMSSFMEAMTFQPSFEARLRSAYQNLLQIQMLTDLVEIDLDNYVSDIEMILTIFQHLIQQFPPIEAENYVSSPVDV